MQCNQLTPTISRAIRSFSGTADLYDPITDWQPAIGVDRVRATIKPQNGNASDMILRLGVQYAATRPEIPGDWAAAATTTVTPGSEVCIPATLAPDAESKMWYRLGLQSNLNGGSPNTVDVAFQAAWNACGRVAVQRSLSVLTLTPENKSVAVLTDWMPVIGVDAVKAAIELARVDKVAGNFYYRIAYQKAAADVATPGAWTALSKDYVHNDTAINTGELGLDLSDSMFVRFGLQYWQTTSDLSRVDINVTLGVRHDPLANFGTIPTDWGINEGGMTDPTISNTRAVYSGAGAGSNTICDSYANESDNVFSLSAYGWTTGNPSGPGAQQTGAGQYVWVGYDASAGSWKVYSAASLSATPTAVGSSLTGPANAIARVVGASGTCSWEVSLDGRNFTTLHTIANSFAWVMYILRKDAVYTVKRELRA
jgi:hypothetical protein